MKNYFRYEYAEQDGRMVRQRTDVVYLWVPVNTESGEVDGDPQWFGDELRPLSKGWEWKKTVLTFAKN